MSNLDDMRESNLDDMRGAIIDACLTGKFRLASFHLREIFSVQHFKKTSEKKWRLYAAIHAGSGTRHFYNTDLGSHAGHRISRIFPNVTHPNLNFDTASDALDFIRKAQQAIRRTSNERA